MWMTLLTKLQAIFGLEIAQGIIFQYQLMAMGTAYLNPLPTYF